MATEPLITTPAAVLRYDQTFAPAYPADWTNAHVYGRNANPLDETIQRQIFLQAAVSIVVSVPFVAVIYFFCSEWPMLSAVSVTTFVITQFIVTIIRSFGIAARMRREWKTFRLCIADQGLLRTIPGHRDVLVPAAAIDHIQESPRSLKLLSSRGQSLLIIDNTLEDFAGVRNHLAARFPARPAPPAWIAAARSLGFSVVLPLCGFANLIGGIFARDLSAELTCLAMGSVIWFWMIGRNLVNPDLSERQKLFSFTVILFPLALILKIAIVHVILKR